VVYVSEDRLWVRELSRLEPRELPGTEGARWPVWSPDGQFIAYAKDEGIWKVPVQGGEAAAIAIGVGGIGGAGGLSWGPDGRIVFARGGSGLFEVSSRGGDPRSLRETDEETENDLHNPVFLPDGSGVLYVTHRKATAPDTISVFAGGESKEILQIEDVTLRSPVYSPTGHILYRRMGTKTGLWAVPFSLSRHEATGEPFLVDPEGSDASAPSAGGALLFVRGAGSGLRQLVWVSREGVVEGTVGQPQTNIGSPVISPDGRRVAVMGQEDENWDIWIHDVDRGTRTRLTFSSKMDWDPTWMPDGSSVVFWDGETRAISKRAADGTGETERIVAEELDDSGVPTITPDGKTMVFWVERSSDQEDLWVQSLDGEGTPTPLLETAAVEDAPRISPDGRHLAYVSDESGRNEVYLTRFPGGEGKWQVSVNGGQAPVWDRSGDKIFYREKGALMEVDVDTDPTVRLGSPRKLFEAKDADVLIRNFHRFDVAPDGERFIMVQELKQEGVYPSLVLVENWAEEFRAE
jgi:Tol biopolymer transport system component